jgi:hypothetical protein
MISGDQAVPTSVEAVPTFGKSSAVTDELERIKQRVRMICPSDAAVTFEFDSKLRINIDVRDFEDVTRIETLLPGLCGGIFSHLERGSVDNHPFFHRLTAIVAR